jgi:hypothetical protein
MAISQWLFCRSGINNNGACTTLVQAPSCCITGLSRSYGLPSAEEPQGRSSHTLRLYRWPARYMTSPLDNALL